MFRPGTIPPNKMDLNIALSGGGIGDLIGYLVSVDYMLKNFPWLNIHLWVPDFTKPLMENLLQHRTLNIGTQTEAKTNFNDTYLGVTTNWSKHTAMRTHPVDYGFHALVDSHQYDLADKNYLKLNPIDVSKFSLPKKYVVISVSSVEFVKRFEADTVNSITTYLLSNSLTPVFVGVDKDDQVPAGIDLNKGINLLNKTNLLELGSIIAKSQCFVGIDGGSVHLAGCTDVPIIAGYTFASPKHLMPIRNDQLGWNMIAIEQPKELGCRYCQTNMAWIKAHDFRQCIYGPDDYACRKNLTADKYILALEQLLKL